MIGRHTAPGGEDAKGRILIVDDDRDFANSLVAILKARGYELAVAENGDEAREVVEEHAVQVALLDIRLGSENGIDLARELRTIRPELVCIMMTGYADTNGAIAALRQGAYDYLRKPLSPHFLLTVLTGAFEKLRLEREKAEAEAALRERVNNLQESEARHRAITESAQDAIITADAEGNILFWNTAAEKIFGLTAAEVVGRNMMDCIVPSRYHESKGKGLAEFRRTGRGPAIGRTLELAALRKDGTEFPIELSLSGYETTNGFVAVALVRDITDRKQAEEELRRAKEAAEAATRAKSEFLANMSHEIRTPMTAVLGFTDVLLERGDLENAPKESIEAAETIKNNGEYLLQLIDNILDLSKIEADKMTIERIRCSPCRLVAEVTSLARVRADAKGLRLGIEYAGPVPEAIQTDPTRLRQILINVIGNAIKFTEVGEVRLLTRFANDGNERLMEFDVVDTGLGMTEIQVAQLFQPFMQADTSTTRRFGGTGLGLAISKRLAGLLGGDIAVVETRQGAGTRMRVTVATGLLDGVKMIEDPLTATVLTPDETSAKASADQPALHGDRILLAEDAPDSQRLIAHVLKKAGAEVIVVENGDLAVDAALSAHNAGNPFDVILMDMQMPVMDGYEATGLLRQNGYTGLIIALTAHAMAGDREKCIRAGCDEYASKPIDHRKLIETIRRRLQPSPIPA